MSENFSQQHLETIVSGSRVIFCGDSGSGKTVALSYIAKHYENPPIIIFETKDEPELDKIARMHDRIAIVRNGSKVVSAAKSHDIIYYRANLDEANDHKYLDAVIVLLLSKLQRNFTVIIDEGYMLHSPNGRAGSGLNGLFTRGRSLHITTMMGVQRPTWISITCLAQTTHLFSFELSFPEDRKKLAGIFPKMTGDNPTGEYHSQFVTSKKSVLLNPFPLIKKTVPRKFLY